MTHRNDNERQAGVVRAPRLLRMVVSACIAGPGLFAMIGLAQAQDIVAASDVGYAPFSMVKDNGEFEGIDVDIAAALSRRIKAQIKIIDQPWATTFPGLNARKFDLVLSPGTVTAERLKTSLFLEPYGDSAFGFLQRKGAPEIKTIEDMRGKTISVNRGNVSDKWLTEREAEYGWKIARFGKNTEAQAAVASGQADASMGYLPAVQYTVKMNKAFATAGFVIATGQVYGYAVRLDDIALRQRLEVALECMKETGELAAIYKKWTDSDPPAKSSITTVTPGFGPAGYPNYDSTPHENNCK